jgi:CRISPR/Cas system CMR-associated protein Cmr5 small subunit
MENILELENLRKRKPSYGTIDTGINNTIQEIKDRISGVKETIEETDTSKKTSNVKSLLTQNILEISDTMKRQFRARRGGARL